MVNYTLDQIYSLSVNELQTMSYLQSLQPNIDSFQQLLNDLTSSSSQVAAWRQLIYVCSYVNFILQNNLNNFYIESQNLLQTNLNAGSLTRLAQLATQFQINSNLVINLSNGSYSYATINPSAQIIKYAAATETFDVNGIAYRNSNKNKRC